MTDQRDYKLDLSSAASPAEQSTARPYLSVQFACCGVYQRIYRDRDGQSYHGRCPKCGKPVRFAVGQGGTDARFFIVR
ncbi:MAG: hypothetical protein IT446_09530 [Phycisphaerales bacterium]|jgi:hypothetical protein|nr:hypothetical protein [Phycisphaerales bacterium]